MLIRRTSPWTRIIGGRPADRCRSEALFLTEKASSWVMSMNSQAAQSIMTSIIGNLQQVRSRVARACAQAGRDVQAVTLLAVSKTQGVAALRAAAAGGQRDFGENYVREAQDKIAALGDLRPPLRWHLIGPLQSNKTRVVAESFDWVHTVDRLKIAQRLAEQRPPHLPPLQLCLQVNVDAEASKSGVAPAVLPELARAVAALPRVRLRGLMSIP